MREPRCCSRAALLLALLVALASETAAPRSTSSHSGCSRGALCLRGGFSPREAAAIECLKAFTQPDAKREGDDEDINAVRTRARAGGW